MSDVTPQEARLIETIAAHGAIYRKGSWWAPQGVPMTIAHVPLGSFSEALIRQAQRKGLVTTIQRYRYEPPWKCVLSSAGAAIAAERAQQFRPQPADGRPAS